MKFTFLLLALLSIFTLNFFIRILPFLLGYKVPYGWVDTAYHMSVALDVKEGNWASLFHPWWHLPQNNFYLNNTRVIDRLRTAFFYPPLLHLLLTFAMLFTHPGIATIATISFLYSLSTIAMFLFSRAHGMKNPAALLSSFLISLSIPLLYSQNFGFWSFAIALIFTLFSNSLFKFYLKEYQRKLLALSIIFGCLAMLTHWLFGAVVLLLALVTYDPTHKKEVIRFYLSFGGISLAFISLFFAFSNTSYDPTYFYRFFLENMLFYPLGIIGWVLAFSKNWKHILVLPIPILFLLFFKGGLRIAFADMLQFTFPFLLAFYITYLYQSGWKNFKLPLLFLLILLAGFNFFQLAEIQLLTKPDLTNEQLDSLLQLRSSFRENANTILTIEKRYGPWITLVAKNSKIIDPFRENGIKELEGFRTLCIKLINGTFILA